MGLDDEQPVEPPEETPKPAPRRRNRASSSASKPRVGRVDRRAQATKETLQEILRLRKPDLDVEGLSFVEVVDRDADAWGRFVAQMAERFVPFGQLVDLIFGAPLMALIGLAPSVRAARRDLNARKTRKQYERERARAEQEAAQAQAEAQPPWVPAEPEGGVPLA